MCAADPGEGWEDSCQGDSGGPLFDKEKDLLVGVVSFGEGCAKHDYPGVYAKISDQAEWIKDTICNDYTFGETNRPDFCDSPIVPAPTPSPTPPYRCTSDLETAVEFELITDSYPEETKVTLTNSDTGKMLGELSFLNEDDAFKSTSNILRACILPSQQSGEVCVDLIVTDDEEDGIFVPGGFELHMDGIEKVWEYSNEEWTNKTYSKLCVAGRKASDSSATSLLYDTTTVNWMLKLGILMLGPLLLY